MIRGPMTSIPEMRASASGGSSSAEPVQVFIRIRPELDEQASGGIGSSGDNVRKSIQLSQSQRMSIAPGRKSFAQQQQQGQQQGQKAEGGEPPVSCIHVRDAFTMQILAPGDSNSSVRKTSSAVDDKLFCFDRIFTEDCRQEKVYESVSAHVQATVKGYNTTIFAYGSTGSGKSYTMTGTASAPGIIPRAISEIFSIIQTTAAQEPDVFFYVRLSYVELYNNSFRNLLESASKELGLAASSKEQQQAQNKGASKDDRDDEQNGGDGLGQQGQGSSPSQTHTITNRGDKIEVRESSAAGVFLAGPNIRIPVTTAHEAFQLIARGNKARAVAATQCNDFSSRSHAILTLHVESRVLNAAHSGGGVGGIEGAAPPPSELRLGKMHLVDLAGSERVKLSGAEGDTLVESQNINLSLSALGDVLSALSRNATILAQSEGGGSKKAGGGILVPVPYRNSKLTHLLKDSLGGNSKTIMIATVRTLPEYYQQTAVSLMYAARAKKVRNKSLVNRNVVGDTGIQAITMEIERLRSRLDERSSEFHRLRDAQMRDAEENATLKSRLTDMNRTNEAEKRQLEAQLSHIIHSQAGQLSTQTQKITLLQASLQDELAKSQNRIAEQEREIRWLKKALDESAVTASQPLEKLERMQQVVEALQEQAHYNKQQISFSDKQIVDLKADLEAVNSELARAHDEIRSISQDKELTEQAMQEASTKCTALEASLRHSRADLSSLKTQQETQLADSDKANAARIQELERERNALRDKLSSTVANLERTLSSVVDQASDRVAKAESAAAEAHAAYVEGAHDCELLRAGLVEARDALEDLQRSNKELSKDIKAITKQLHEERKAHESTSAYKASLEVTVAELNSKIAQMNDTCHTAADHLTTQKADFESELTSKSLEIASLRKAAQEAQKKADKALARLQKETDEAIADMKQQLANELSLAKGAAYQNAQVSAEREAKLLEQVELAVQGHKDAEAALFQAEEELSCMRAHGQALENEFTDKLAALVAEQDTDRQAADAAALKTRRELELAAERKLSQTIKDLEEKWLGKLQAAEGEQMAQIKALQDEFTESRDREVARLRSALEHNKALETEALLTRCEQDKDASLQALLTRCEQDKDASLQALLTRCEQDKDASLQALLMRCETDKLTALEALQVRCDTDKASALEKLQSSWELDKTTSLESVRLHCSGTLTELAEAHQQALLDLSSRHQEELHALEHDLNAAAEEDARLADGKLADMQKAHASALESAARQLAEQQAQYKQATKDASKAHQARVNEIVAQMEHVLEAANASAQSTLQIALDGERQELNEQHRLLMASAQEQWQEDHEARLAEARAQAQRELTAVLQASADIQQQLDVVRAKASQESGSQSAEAEALRSQLASDAATIQHFQAATKALTQQLETARRELQEAKHAHHSSAEDHRLVTAQLAETHAEQLEAALREKETCTETAIREEHSKATRELLVQHAADKAELERAHAQMQALSQQQLDTAQAELQALAIEVRRKTLEDAAAAHEMALQHTAELARLQAAHKEDKAELHKSLDTVHQTSLAQAAAQQTALAEEAKRERETLQKRLDEAIAQLATANTERLQLESAHDKTLAKFTLELAQAQERCTEILSSSATRHGQEAKALCDQRIEFDRILQASLSEREAHFKQSMKQLEDNLELDRQLMQGNMERSKARHDAEMANVTAEYESSARRLEVAAKERLSTELALTNERHAAALSAALEGALVKHRQEVAALRSDKASLEDQLQAAVAAAQAKHEELVGAQNRHRTELEAMLEGEFRTLEGRQKAAMLAAEASFDARETRLQALHAQQCKALVQESEAAVSAAVAEERASSQQRLSALKEAHRSEVEQMTIRLDSERRTLEQQHGSSLRAALEASDESSAAVIETLEGRLQDERRKHAEALARMESQALEGRGAQDKMHASRVAALEEELDSLREASAQLKRKQSAELHELRATLEAELRHVNESAHQQKLALSTELDDRHARSLQESVSAMRQRLAEEHSVVVDRMERAHAISVEQLASAVTDAEDRRVETQRALDTLRDTLRSEKQAADERAALQAQEVTSLRQALDTLSAKRQQELATSLLQHSESAQGLTKQLTEEHERLRIEAAENHARELKAALVGKDEAVAAVARVEAELAAAKASTAKMDSQRAAAEAAASRADEALEQQLAALRDANRAANKENAFLQNKLKELDSALREVQTVASTNSSAVGAAEKAHAQALADLETRCAAQVDEARQAEQRLQAELSDVEARYSALLTATANANAKNAAAAGADDAQASEAEAAVNAQQQQHQQQSVQSLQGDYLALLQKQTESLLAVVEAKNQPSPSLPHIEEMEGRFLALVKNLPLLWKQAHASGVTRGEGQAHGLDDGTGTGTGTGSSDFDFDAVFARGGDQGQQSQSQSQSQSHSRGAVHSQPHSHPSPFPSFHGHTHHNTQPPAPPTPPSSGQRPGGSGRVPLHLLVNDPSGLGGGHYSGSGSGNSTGSGSNRHGGGPSSGSGGAGGSGQNDANSSTSSARAPLPWTSPTLRSSPTDQLVAAILDGDVQGIRAVVRSKGDDLSSPFWKELARSVLPLHRAVSGLHFHGSERLLVATIEALTQLGADVNATDQAGNTVLHKAIQVCTSKSVGCVVQTLLARGAQPGAKNRNGDSALHMECDRVRSASADVIAQLIKAGASPSARNSTSTSTSNSNSSSSSSGSKAPLSPLTIVLLRGAKMNAGPGPGAGAGTVDSSVLNASMSMSATATATAAAAVAASENIDPANRLGGGGGGPVENNDNGSSNSNVNMSMSMSIVDQDKEQEHSRLSSGRGVWLRAAEVLLSAGATWDSKWRSPSGATQLHLLLHAFPAPPQHAAIYRSLVSSALEAGNLNPLVQDNKGVSPIAVVCERMRHVSSEACPDAARVMRMLLDGPSGQQGGVLPSDLLGYVDSLVQTVPKSCLVVVRPMLSGASSLSVVRPMLSSASSLSVGAGGHGHGLNRSSRR